MLEYSRECLMVVVNAGVQQGMLNGCSECWRVVGNAEGSSEAGLQQEMLNDSSECWCVVRNVEWEE